MSESGDAFARLEFPKPGPLTKWVLGVLGGVGVLNAVLVNLGGWTKPTEWMVGESDKIIAGQAWRLLSYALVSDPNHLTTLLLSLLVLYFFLTDLERIWSRRRILQFIFTSALIGGGAVTLLDAAIKGVSWVPTHFHTGVFFGFGAIDMAITVAWAHAFANRTIRLFFFVPVRGGMMKWLSVGYVLAAWLIFAERFLAGAPGILAAWAFSMLISARKSGPQGPKKSQAALKRRPSLKLISGGADSDRDVDPPSKPRWLN